MPTFFMSSAAGDDDHYVEQFHRDLCARVAELTGEPADEVGHLGTVGAGTARWPDRMAAALGRCDVFIALCSPRYWLNNTCGRQYRAFSERLREHENRSGERPPALIPLMWTPTTALTGAAPLFVRPDDGTAHRGLRRYVRLRGLRPEYREFLDRLAGRIVAVAGAHRIPQDVPIAELAATPSAFSIADLRESRRVGAPAAADVPPAGDAAQPGEPATTRSRSRGSGSQHVHFVVAAGSREEMEQVREDLSYYGEAAEDWAPYQPVLARPLADHAQALAAEQLIGSEVAEIGAIGAIGDRIELASRNNEVVVLLVDPWTTQLAPYRRLLAEADRRGLGAAAVLVPVSRTDPETGRNSDQLGFSLRQTFRNCAGHPATLFRGRIETPDGFAADLTSVLEEARNRVFWEGRVHHSPPGDPVGDRPILRGP